jgi:hypothetical protein
VQVLWPEGTPVVDANVWLSPRADPTAVVGTSVSHTDKNGNFDLTGFEGYDYILHADKHGERARESCIKPLLIRAGETAIPRISLPLVSTECANSSFEAPSDSSRQ